jgi:CRP/FNR family transcriptional regulator, cyclic AMP receptor protein
MDVTMQARSEHFTALASLGIKRHYRADTVILYEGDSGDALYLLLTGQVRIYSQSVTGKILTHGTISAGQYFGEMALDGGQRSASVQAMEDCECVLVPNAQVLLFASAQSDFATHLLHTVIGRARSTTEAAKNMALLDVYARLWKALDHAFETCHDVCTLTHKQLADQIGASREMVSKLIKDLERGGYVQSLHRRELKRLQKIPMRW